MIFLKMQHAGDRVRFIGLSSGGLYPTASSSRYNSCKMLSCSSISPFKNDCFIYRCYFSFEKCGIGVISNIVKAITYLIYSHS